VAFHLGRPILVMSVLAVVGGAAVAWRPAPPPTADLVLWVSAEPHRETYASLVEPFRRRTGKGFVVERLATRTEDVRLVSLFMSGSRDVPDLVEIEIGSAAKYLRPPADQVRLLPLNAFLSASGWIDKVVAARFAPWRKGDVIFGVPHDVHPVAIAYREDFFREAGVDLPAARTWPEFRDACLRFHAHWRSRGVTDRYAIELATGSADHLTPMLLQRHVNPIDGDGRIHVADEKVIDTLVFYAQCVAGPTNIAAQTAGSAGAFARELEAGRVCAMLMPDWRVDELKRYAPGLAGKLRMMPMPVFEPGDARTATWGGTMIGIPRNCKDPAASWALIEFLYFSAEGLAARRRHSGILPPVTTAWADPAYARGDDFFGGQPVGALYVDLAKELPARYATPATPIASAYLSKAIADAAAYVRDRPADVDGLRARLRQQMRSSEADLRRRIEHGKFGE
jgi:arabinosaccharide transport system substrate-binding protein